MTERLVNIPQVEDEDRCYECKKRAFSKNKHKTIVCCAGNE
jgi:hypothetical protein